LTSHRVDELHIALSVKRGFIFKRPTAPLSLDQRTLR
jgi:hypothetical protein